MTVSPPLIFFFTDFGSEGPYLGQMEASIRAGSLNADVINLCSDAPFGDACRSSYLLAALSQQLPAGCILVCVVDPDVGSDRAALLVEAGGRTFLGPDNGLLSQVVADDPQARVSWLDVDAAGLSPSFHGRDLFAPTAAELVTGQAVATQPMSPAAMQGADWQRDLHEIIYLDHYGNAYTGLRASRLGREQTLSVNGHALRNARTFSDVPRGEAFWYRNSCGLVEIAVNGGRADRLLGLAVGDSIRP